MSIRYEYFSASSAGTKMTSVRRNQVVAKKRYYRTKVDKFNGNVTIVCTFHIDIIVKWYVNGICFYMKWYWY